MFRLLFRLAGAIVICLVFGSLPVFELGFVAREVRYAAGLATEDAVLRFRLH